MGKRILVAVWAVTLLFGTLGPVFALPRLMIEIDDPVGGGGTIPPQPSFNGRYIIGINGGLLEDLGQNTSPGYLVQATAQALRQQALTTIGCSHLLAVNEMANTVVCESDNLNVIPSVSPLNATSLAGVVTYIENDRPMRLVSATSSALPVPHSSALVAGTREPRDSLFSTQSALKDPINNNDIDAPEGWAYSIGSDEIVVAVVGSGIKSTLPDLSPNMWTNSYEIAGNGIDDDNNDYIDDVHGVDGRAVSQSDDYPANSGTTEDIYGLGTQVASIIAARADDSVSSVGMSGAAWRAKLMPIKVSDGLQFAYSDLLNGLNYVWKQKRYKGVNLRVINIGVAMDTVSPDNCQLDSWVSVLTAMYENNIILVSPAGDQGQSLDGVRTPPFGCPLNQSYINLINVGALNSSGGYASTSNFGIGTVNLAAPGQSVVAANLGGDYGSLTGTQASAALVSGALATYLAKDTLASNSDDISLSQATAKLNSAVQLDPALYSKVTSGGKLKSLRFFVGAPTITFLPVETHAVQIGTPTSFDVMATSDPAASLVYRLGSNAPVGMQIQGHTVTWTPTLDQVGGHDFDITATEPLSGANASTSVHIDVVETFGPPIVPLTGSLGKASIRDGELFVGGPESCQGTWHYGVNQYGQLTILYDRCEHTFGLSAVPKSILVSDLHYFRVEAKTNGRWNPLIRAPYEVFDTNTRMRYGTDGWNFKFDVYPQNDPTFSDSNGLGRYFGTMKFVAKSDNGADFGRSGFMGWPRSWDRWTWECNLGANGNNNKNGLGVRLWTEFEQNVPSPREIMKGASVCLIDDASGSADVTFKLSAKLASRNHAPVLVAVPAQNIVAPTPISIQLSGSDTDDDTLEYGVTGGSALPSGAALDSRTGLFSWTPTAQQAGFYSISVKATDGLAQDVKTINITVARTNAAPVWTLPNEGHSFTVRVGSSLIYCLEASDPDGDSISFSGSGLPPHDAMVGRAFAFTPETWHTFDSSYNITLHATDAFGARSDRHITLYVTGQGGGAMASPLSEELSSTNLMDMASPVLGPYGIESAPIC